jgi:DNA-binding PucR family transcriptional regulator
LRVGAGVAHGARLGAVRNVLALAGRGLQSALAFGTFGVKFLSLRAAVVADEPVTELVAARILEPVRQRGDFGEELLQTMRVYMECEQSIDRAAQELFVHPNTVRHRLARFEELTGTSLRRLEDLAAIWWALSTGGAADPAQP